MKTISKPVALVTGASSGMGKAIAVRLNADGYIVYAAARNVERMSELAVSGILTVAMDVTEDHSMVDVMERILRDQGRMDVLVNAAGYGQFGTLEEVPMAEGRRQMETNLIGIARLVQLCLPAMRARKSGAIVNVSSVGGKLAMPLGGWYHASKFALEGYSDALRNEVRPFGINVIVIQPGGVESEWGGIALAEAKRYSGSGPYAGMVATFAKLQSKAGKQADPKVIGELVAKSLRARRPSARYHGGTLAGTMLFLERHMPPRLLDMLVRAMFRPAKNGR